MLVTDCTAQLSAIIVAVTVTGVIPDLAYLHPVAFATTLIAGKSSVGFVNVGAKLSCNVIVTSSCEGLQPFVILHLNTYVPKPCVGINAAFGVLIPGAVFIVDTWKIPAPVVEAPGDNCIDHVPTSVIKGVFADNKIGIAGQATTSFPARAVVAEGLTLIRTALLVAIPQAPVATA